MSKRIFERRQFQPPTKKGGWRSDFLEKMFRKIFVDNIFFTANIILFSSINGALLEHYKKVPHIIGMMATLSIFTGVICLAYFINVIANKIGRNGKNKVEDLCRK